MSVLAWVVLACVATAGSYALVRWLRQPVVFLPEPEPEIAPEAVARPEAVPEPVLAPISEPVPEPEPALVPAPDLVSARRWVTAVSAAAPLVSLGLYVHHRRFVQYHAHKGIQRPMPFGTWLRAETLGAGTLGWWYVTGFRKDGLRIPENAVGRPVLCVHGYSQNATNFVGLRRVLEADGRPTVAISLGHRLAPMEWYALRLARKLEEMASAHADGFDVVAHSMGGVVLRMVLSARSELRPAVRTVVTLGSPHRGTAAARGIPWVPELVALRRRSALLRELPQLTELVPDGRVVTIAGDTDTIVYPVESSLLPGAESVVLPGIGHAGLLTSPVSWDAVRRALR